MMCFHRMFALGSRCNPAHGRRTGMRTRERERGQIRAICGSAWILCPGVRLIQPAMAPANGFAAVVPPSPAPFRLEGRIACTSASFNGTGWVIQFSAPSADGPLGRSRTLATADATREMILRTPTPVDLAARQALDAAFERGRGGLFLELTPEQYRKVIR